MAASAWGSSSASAEARRLEERRAGLGTAGLAPGHAEAHEELASLLGWYVWHQGGGDDGPLQLHGHVGGRLRGLGRRRRSPRVGERLWRGAGDEALGRVVGEVRDPRLEVIGAEGLDHVGRAGVHRRQPRCVELGGQRA